MNERINFDVDAAFDPTSRAAQADFDAYLLSRPANEAERALAETTDFLPVEHAFGPEPAVITRGPEPITETFNKPVIPEQHQSKPDRIGMMFDDIRDNHAWVIPPCTAEYDGYEADMLLERLLPYGAASAVRRLGQAYEDGHVYRRITHVGDKEKHTFHPHYYFMDKTHPGKTRMYFVDPEHKVANKSFLRPPIVNLVGIEVPDQEDEEPKVAILRCRIPMYDQAQKPEGMGPEELRTVIEQALDRGELPDRFSDDSEKEVLFMIAASENHSRVQARYSTKRQIRAFAKGQRGSSALEGKVWVNAYVVNKLITLFNQPAEVREVA